MKKHLPAILFVIALFVIAFYYGYGGILLKRPQSTHTWRQTDCASLALNYYQGGMHFFLPETNNLTSDGGKSGKAATSEIPVLYFMVALLYKVFGYHEYIYRLINTLLFLIGLLYLFKTIFYLTKDAFWSVGFSLLVFTSPVTAYYGNNFLTNSSALAFSITGVYYFLKYFGETRKKYLVCYTLFFLLAAACKITSLISFFGFTFAAIVHTYRHRNQQIQGRPFSQYITFILPVALVCLIAGSWILYAIHYNQLHGCSYFSTTTFPIWGLSGSAIKDILHNIKSIWLGQYFHYSVLLFFAGCMGILLVHFKKSDMLLAISLFVSCMAAIIFILLQFWTLADHDYYLLDLYIIPVLLLTNMAYLIAGPLKIQANYPWVKILYIVFLLFNIHYCHTKLNERYNGWMNDYSKNRDFYSITPYLRQIGIQSKDTVISIPDISHASLYLMNLKGWTEYTDAKFNRGVPIHYNQDSAGIESSIRNGARYLIVNGIEELYKKPYLQSVATHLTGTYHKILIFDISGRDKRNYTLPEQSLWRKYTCKAEMKDPEGHHFPDSVDSTVLFANAETQSPDVAYSGRYSCKLTQQSPYGMTLKLNDIEAGERFEITVVRKSFQRTTAGIIASVDAPQPYYNNNDKLLSIEPGGWQKLQLNVFATPEMAGKELVIYVYNPENQPVYFDDLEVLRYRHIEK